MPQGLHGKSLLAVVELGVCVEGMQIARSQLEVVAEVISLIHYNGSGSVLCAYNKKLILDICCLEPWKFLKLMH